MSKLLTGAICLTDIPKEKIWKAKSGKQYLSINVWLNDDADSYGNHASIQVNQSKEEREAKEPKKYIGNLKYPQSNDDATIVVNSSSEVEDDLPF
jgi:hypothetical protein